MQSEPIARQIRSAFAHTRLPASDPVVTSTYDDEGTTVHFAGTHWSDHEPQTLDYYTDSMMFFTPAAKAFFLPAFLLAALTAPRSGAAEAVLCLLTPPKSDVARPSYMAWWSLLSAPQKLAVVAFLRAMSGEFESVACGLEANLQ